MSIYYSKQDLVAAFIDAHLQLTPEEEIQFNAEIEKLEPRERDELKEYLTTWERRGIERGIEQGRIRGRIIGATSLVLKVLTHKIGRVSQASVKRIEKLPLESIEELAVALLDFEKPSDLTAWLKANADVAAA